MISEKTDAYFDTLTGVIVAVTDAHKPRADVLIAGMCATLSVYIASIAKGAGVPALQVAKEACEILLAEAQEFDQKKDPAP